MGRSEVKIFRKYWHTCLAGRLKINTRQDQQKWYTGQDCTAISQGWKARPEADKFQEEMEGHSVPLTCMTYSMLPNAACVVYLLASYLSLLNSEGETQPLQGKSESSISCVFCFLLVTLSSPNLKECCNWVEKKAFLKSSLDLRKDSEYSHEQWGGWEVWSSGAEANPQEDRIHHVSTGGPHELQLRKRKKIPWASFIHKTFPWWAVWREGLFPLETYNVLVPSHSKRPSPHLVFTCSVVWRRLSTRMGP